MALAGSGIILGQAIKAAVQSAAASNQGQDPSVLQQAIYQAMGEAIIAHLVNPAFAPTVAVTVGAGAPGAGSIV